MVRYERRGSPGGGVVVRLAAIRLGTTDVCWTVVRTRDRLLQPRWIKLHKHRCDAPLLWPVGLGAHGLIHGAFVAAITARGGHPGK